MWLRGWAGDKRLFYLAPCLKRTTVTQTEEGTDVNTIQSDQISVSEHPHTHALQAASRNTKYSGIWQNWGSRVSLPFYCFTAVFVLTFFTHTHKTSLESQTLSLPPFVSISGPVPTSVSISHSGPKHIWLWEEEKQPGAFLNSCESFFFFCLTSPLRTLPQSAITVYRMDCSF